MADKRWKPGQGTPDNYVIACFADAPAAEAALGSLRENGFADDDLISLHGYDAYEQMRHTGDSILRRIGWALENQGGDTQTGRADYMEEFRQGHSVVFVYAPTEDQAASANRIVQAANGYRISYHRRWTTTTLG